MNDQSPRKPQQRAAYTAHASAMDDQFMPSDVSRSSPIGQRLRLDMDSLFRKGHTRVLSRAADDRDARDSAEPSRDAQSLANVMICRRLNQSIADCLDLQSQCRQARWRLADSAYLEHRSICTQAIQLVEHYVGLLGNRIVQLDGIVDSSVRQIAERSGLNEYPAEAEDPQTHINSVAFALWLVSGAMREDCDEITKLGDATSFKLLDQTAGSLARCLELLENLSPEPAVS